MKPAPFAYHAPKSVDEAVAVGAARLQEVRRHGAIGVLVPCPAVSAAGKAWLGDHDGAYAVAGEAEERCWRGSRPPVGCTTRRSGRWLGRAS